MLVICYGITKSGSTLAFELVKGMLESAGHPQTILPEEVIGPRERINFVDGPMSRDRVKSLLRAIGRKHKVAVKTHAKFDERELLWYEAMQARGRLQIVASYRDPRDICLSMVDAGAHARRNNRETFSSITDLASAIASVQRQYLLFRKWGAIRGTLRLDYEVAAFEPEKAMALIGERLAIRYDCEAVKRYVFEEAFTQKNKAQTRRHTTDLSAEQLGEVTAAFDTILHGLYGADGGKWFADCRDELLAKFVNRKKTA